VDQEGRGQLVARLKLAKSIECVGIPLDIPLKRVGARDLGRSGAGSGATPRSWVRTPLQKEEKWSYK